MLPGEMSHITPSVGSRWEDQTETMAKFHFQASSIPLATLVESKCTGAPGFFHT